MLAIVLFFFLNLDAFLGFDRLVQAIGEPPSLHNTTSKAT